MRLSFIISPPNDRRWFGAHTTLSFDCPCRLSIGTACGCILIAIFPCLVNMSLSFTGLKESPREDVQSKKKRLGQNCGKTVKREWRKRARKGNICGKKIPHMSSVTLFLTFNDSVGHSIILFILVSHRNFTIVEGPYSTLITAISPPCRKVTVTWEMLNKMLAEWVNK